MSPWPPNSGTEAGRGAPAPEPELAPLAEADFAAADRLARTIWHAHYGPMIGAAQIDYMLDRRFAPETLRLYLGADDRWFRLLRVAGEPVGYCSYALTGTPGEMKLEQLYLLSGRRGTGLGGLMLHHVEAAARERGCDRLTLQVAKANGGSIAVYRKAGFTVREAVVFDIGDGHVMDDYVMEKRLG